MIPVLSLVEITAFRLESKFCKGFFFEKLYFPPMRDLEFLTDHVTFKQAPLYSSLLTENHPRDFFCDFRLLLIPL